MGVLSERKALYLPLCLPNWSCAPFSVTLFLAFYCELKTNSMREEMHFMGRWGLGLFGWSVSYTEAWSRHRWWLELSFALSLALHVPEGLYYSHDERREHKVRTAHFVLYVESHYNSHPFLASNCWCLRMKGDSLFHTKSLKLNALSAYRPI